MPALRDELLAGAGELLDDQAPEWLDKAVARGREEIGHVVADVNRNLPDGVEVTEEQTRDVLDLLEEGKAPVLRLGAVAFAWVVANLESGDKLEACRLYLEQKATYLERNAAIDAAGDAAFDEAKERADAWEAFLGFLATVAETVGEVGLTILVALARKFVGL